MNHKENLENIVQYSTEREYPSSPKNTVIYKKKDGIFSRLYSKFSRLLFTGVSSLAFSLTPNSLLANNKVYWMDDTKIKRANLDGTQVETLMTHICTEGIAVNTFNDKIYWTDICEKEIKRSNLDGSNIEDIVTGLKDISEIALDIPNNKMYWTNLFTGGVKRANLDGSNIEDIIVGDYGESSFAIALDLIRGKVYWTRYYANRETREWYPPEITRANLDGTQVETFLVTPGVSIGLAIDMLNDKIYWNNWDNYIPEITRANLDGSNIESIITLDSGSIYGITLDITQGTLYWLEASPGKIKRSNLDGSNIESIVTGLNNPMGISLDLGRDPCIFGDSNCDSFINLDDYQLFNGCLFFSGPEKKPPLNCLELFDFDHDGDVDLKNFSLFQQAFTGLEGLVDSDSDRIPDIHETNTGNYLSSTNTGTDPFNPDTDNDGLNDGDEVYGTIDGLALNRMGASPVKKDIFIEVDWTEDSLDGGTHSHRPSTNAISSVITAFANSPVSNPYTNPTGVNIHIDYGQDNIFTGGNIIPGSPSFIRFNDEFYALKEIHFAQNRNGRFHYAIFTHRHNNDTNSSSGIAELPGDDFMVTLPFSSQDNSMVSKALMHELGHNLSLKHGGTDILNQKPNYNSIMNYRYQFPGVDRNCDALGDGVMDYSSGLLLPIDENYVNECNGICGPGFPIDWNNSGMTCEIDIPLNLTVGEEGSETLDILNDSNDWRNINLSSVSITTSSIVQEIISCRDDSSP